MILSFTLNNIAFQAEGDIFDIAELVATLDKKATNVKILAEKTKSSETKFNKPVTSNLTQEQRDYILALFPYPMSNKANTGKPAYMMALMLDGKPHTVAELCKLGNCTSSTIRTVISRLQASGSTVEVNSNRLAKNTIVQVTNITSQKLAPAKRKPSVKLNPAQGFQNLSI
jgi:biotin operon repressor